MCGSGTIAIEAALIAADRAPGLARTFGFQKLAWFDGPAWQRIKQARARPHAAGAGVAARLRERRLSARRREDAREPAHAQVDAFVRVEQADVLARAAPAPTGVLHRQSALRRAARRQGALAAFYPQLGDALKQRFAGWTACFFTGDLRLPS